MSTLKKKSLSLLLAGVMTSQLAGCGTVFYPERKGQQGGKIDPVVAIANGIGLLFIVPGIVAFVIDFSTGAIYLPGGKRAELTPDAASESLTAHLYASTGQQVNWQQDALLIGEVRSLDEIEHILH